MARVVRLAWAALAAAACGPITTTPVVGTATVTVRNLAAVVWTARFTADSGASAALVIPAAKLCWRNVAIPNTLELLSSDAVRIVTLTDSGGLDVRVNADTTLTLTLGPRAC